MLDSALIVTAIIMGVITIYLSRSRINDGQTVEAFLLGNRQLPTGSVTNLLLSSSFGINALFYNGWLGYQLGLWAIFIQVSWAASFFLLSQYTTKFKVISSLHDLLGQRFGIVTKIIGAICSVIGITYFVGWELAIGRSAIESMMINFGEASSQAAVRLSGLLTLVVIAFTIIYTLRGGIRGNADVNKMLNFVKIFIVATFVLISLITMFAKGDAEVLMPSLSVPLATMGAWGLVTNVLFNLSWQFVDNSSWQSAISGGGDEANVSKNLRISGLSVFLTIGVLGTLLGAALRLYPEIQDVDFFTTMIQAAGTMAPLAALVFSVVIIAAMMSLIDGMLLAVALTIVVDLIPQRWTDSERRLTVARWSLVFLGITAGWGIGFLLSLLGGNLFDFVYVVVISQLVLFGPVIVALTSSARFPRDLMWLSIVLGLCAGFGAVYIGTLQGVSWLVDGAGTLALIVSYTSARIIERIPVLNSVRE